MVVTLTPGADAGWTLVGWQGTNAVDSVDNRNGTWSLTMDGIKSAQAVFVPEAYTLNATVEGQGQVMLTPQQAIYYEGLCPRS
jgi:hypothetical protein